MLGHVIALPRAVGVQVVRFRVEKIDAAHHGMAQIDRVVVRIDANVVEISTKHDRRIGERSAARPAPHFTRIARARQRLAAFVPTDVDRIAIDPRHRMLARLGDAKAIAQEALRVDVEFPYHHRVRSSGRQRHKRAIAVRIENVEFDANPRRALCLPERIEVEQVLPDRFAVAPARP